MATPNPDHPVSTGAQGLPRSRSVGRQGHSETQSGSSTDDSLSLGMTRRQDEEEQDVQPDSFADVTNTNLPRNENRRFGWAFLPRRIRPFSSRVRKIIAVAFVLFIIGIAWTLYRSSNMPSAQESSVDSYTPPMSEPRTGHTTEGEQRNPIQWLRENTILKPEELSAQEVQALIESRPKAAFVALVRNEELEGMLASIQQVEMRFNAQITRQYDWVFFNKEEFTEEFKAAVSEAISGRCFFERIPEEHWSTPTRVDEARSDVPRQFLATMLESYHHMCRWNSDLFALEERLKEYKYYWRVEPNVQFHCDINYDVFRFMEDNDMVYGFNMAILGDARLFPSFWEETKSFIDENGDLVDKDDDFDRLLHTADDRDDVIRPHTGAKEALSDGEYSNCQFYSNFEVGSLDFFRSKSHLAYFLHLDRAGGFYYERLGNAPIHTLSISLFTPKTKLWYFRDIGYSHGLCEQCPPHGNQLEGLGHSPDGLRQRDTDLKADTTQLGSLSITVGFFAPSETLDSQHRRWKTIYQDVERQKKIPGLSCGCTVSAMDSNNDKLVPYESKQRKPSHTCIRKFLGGKWLVRKDLVSDLNSTSSTVLDGFGYVLDD